MDTDKLQRKLFEQPFTVIILVGVIVFQTNMHKNQISRLHDKEDQVQAEYEKTVQQDRDALMSRSEGLVEAIKSANRSKDEDKEKLFRELIKVQQDLYDRLLDCERNN